MNQVFVGELRYSSRYNPEFEYASSWLSSSYARPISLSIPLTIKRSRGEVIYNFFDNLLPDNDQLRRRIQRRFRTKSDSCFDLLSEIGRDCVGALQILSSPMDSDIEQSIEATPLTGLEIEEALKNYNNAPLGMNEEQDFRISIAGAQEKTAFLFCNGNWHRPYGSTPTSHIFKLPIGRLAHSGLDLSESVENEWLCSRILGEFGLSVANSKIEKFTDFSVLVVERFDRKWTNNQAQLLRLPQEDFCQSLGISSAHKYESDGGPGIKDIMQVLLGSLKAEEDRKNFMIAQLLFWVLGAIDGHAKNYSIFIDKGGNYHLTPFYDVISAYPMIFSKQVHELKVKMAMSVIGSKRNYLWHRITREH